MPGPVNQHRIRRDDKPIGVAIPAANRRVGFRLPPGIRTFGLYFRPTVAKSQAA
jgi:hypothetical protein